MNRIKRRSFLKQTGMMAAALVVPAREKLRAERKSKARKEEPDYTSRVPKYTFADTLQEQESQLKTNPLMADTTQYHRNALPPET